MSPSPKYFFVIPLFFVLVASCAPAPISESIPDQTSKADSISTPGTELTQIMPTLATEAVRFEDSDAVIALTHQRLDGNRLVFGSGVMPTEPLDIPLAGKPLWVVAAPVQAGSVWVVTLDDGQVQAFEIEGEKVSELKLNVSRLPAGMPPVLQVVGNRLDLLSPYADASASTNPIRLEDGAQAYINVHGQLRLIRQADTYTLAVNALPDARILSDEAGRLLFLSAPTEGYPHGVLGDKLEATRITLVDVREEPYVAREIQIESSEVIEGVAPIWVDLDGDGEREIIVTQSNAGSGARVVVYREDGSLYASGDPIGQGFRWRHQLAAGQFVEGGPQEIAVIRTPHIGGVIEIYAVEEGRLTIRAELGGYSSHQIGSRNLDSAVAADFDGDGRIEVVVPDQSQTTLAGIQLTNDELNSVWEAPIGGKISTNLAAITLSDGSLALGIGHARGHLRIWFPK